MNTGSRSAIVPINWSLWSQMHALAEIRGIDAESMLELWLRERLDTTPEIAELVRMRSDARKKADAEWRAKYTKETL